MRIPFASPISSLLADIFELLVRLAANMFDHAFGIIDSPAFSRKPPEGSRTRFKYGTGHLTRPDPLSIDACVAQVALTMGVATHRNSAEKGKISYLLEAGSRVRESEMFGTAQVVYENSDGCRTVRCEIIGAFFGASCVSSGILFGMAPLP